MKCVALAKLAIAAVSVISKQIGRVGHAERLELRADEPQEIVLAQRRARQVDGPSVRSTGPSRAMMLAISSKLVEMTSRSIAGIRS